MTVKQLMDKLAQCNQEASVYVSSDAEGNEIKNLGNIEAGYKTVTLWPK